MTASQGEEESFQSDEKRRDSPEIWFIRSSFLVHSTAFVETARL